MQVILMIESNFANAEILVKNVSNINQIKL